MVYHTFLIIFRPLLVESCIQCSDLREMTSYHAHDNEALLLPSRLLIITSLSIMYICKKW